MTNSTALKHIHFHGFSEDVLSTLANSMRVRDFKAKEVIFQQGHVAQSFFIVLSGALKVTKVNAKGTEIVLSVLGPGMSFGEFALLDGGVRTASVQAMEHCCLGIIDQSCFHALIEKNPELKNQIIKSLCNRLRVLSNRLEQLSYMEVPSRLANAILELTADLGKEMEGNYYLPVKISQRDLAGMVGASRETVNKLLRDWSANGCINFSERRLSIQNLGFLQEIADIRI